MAFDEERFRSIVIGALRISPSTYRPDLKLGDIEEWDSIAHLELASAVEQGFNLRLSVEEIVELTELEQFRVRIKQAA